MCHVLFIYVGIDLKKLSQNESAVETLAPRNEGSRVKYVLI